MTKIIFFIIFLFQTPRAFGDDDCRFYLNCSGSARSSAQSLPSSGSASILNPSSLSNVKGVGVEGLFQANNPIGLSLVTGNGKIGALISSSLENSFFGNRSIEIDDLFYLRRIEQKRYQNKKINLSVGLNLINKKNFGLDLGLSVKRNPAIKKINPGVGLTGRVSFLSFGAFIYQDDVALDLANYVNPYTSITYSSTYQSSIYKEKFTVKSFMAGARLKNLSLDAGAIQTHYLFYQEDTLIYLYSASLSMQNFLFNVALRQETSKNLLYKNGQMLIERKKKDTYLGVSYLLGNHIMLGLHHNHYLLNEYSATLTLFF